jgi:hypothetical protein
MSTRYQPTVALSRMIAVVSSSANSGIPWNALHHCIDEVGRQCSASHCSGDHLPGAMVVQAITRSLSMMLAPSPTARGTRAASCRAGCLSALHHWGVDLEFME